MYDNKTQAFMQQSTIPRNSQGFANGKFTKTGKTHRKFLNRNGQGTDVLNELIAQ